MQTNNTVFTGSVLPYAGYSAILAGLCYTSRWVWELSEGILKNKQYPPTAVTQNFFLVKVLLMVAVTGCCTLTKQNRLARIGFIAALCGLFWTSVTRTAEAYGAPGAWGFFSSPGLLLFIFGTFVLGLSTIRAKTFSIPGYLLVGIANMHFMGSLAAVMVYNLFGRNESANAMASSIANWFFIAEGTCWVIAGCLLLSIKKSFKKHGIVGADTYF